MRGHHARDKEYTLPLIEALNSIAAKPYLNDWMDGRMMSEFDGPLGSDTLFYREEDQCMYLEPLTKPAAPPVDDYFSCEEESADEESDMQ